MNILITGASGLVGQATTQYLNEQGHTVYAMSRTDTNAPFYWCDNGNHTWHIHWDENIIIDAVIHLAGENIGKGRWNTKRKNIICKSRIDTTRALASHFSQLKIKPKVFISASAIGFYGDCGSRIVDENSPAGDDFLTNLAKNWEQEAQKATYHGIRTITIRTGLVLASQGGALEKMVPVFKKGLGGKIGNGRQVMSWVSINEIPKMITFLLHNEHAHGAVNIVSEQAVSNAQFTKALAQAVKRPAFMTVPAFAIKAGMGEMGELLLLSSIHVKPTRLQELGYSFDNKSLEDVLQSMV